jgi:hypothetical protein
MSLTPPIKPVEKEFVTFDFASVLGAGVTISSATVTCEVAEASEVDDEQAAARILSDPTLAASPRTLAANTAAYVLVGTMLDGVLYLLECVANASDGQILGVSTHLFCRAPK